MDNHPMNNTGEAKCPGCGAYHGHYFECEHATIENLRAAVRSYKAAWDRQRKEIEKLNHRNTTAFQSGQAHAAEKIKRAEQQAVFWQGKWAIVKAENNKLRKKLKP